MKTDAEKPILSVKVYDKESVQKHSIFKRNVAIVHSCVAFFLFYGMNALKTYNETHFTSDFLPYLIMGIFLILFLPASGVIFFGVYAQSPSAGDLCFHEDKLVFSKKKNSSQILLSEMPFVRFYIDKYERSYLISLPFKGSDHIYTLDIIFKHEKEKFDQVLEVWKTQKFEVEITDDRTQLKSHNNEIIKNSGNYIAKTPLIEKVKFRTRLKIPLRETCNLPYNPLSKEEAIMLMIDAINYLGWDLSIDQNLKIKAKTETAISYLGDILNIEFSNGYIKIESYSISAKLFTTGLRTNIRKLVSKMNELYLYYDENYLKQEFLKRFESV